MKRPAFQFYPADWRNNAKLRRCSWAARGAWIEVLGLMHDEDEYGVLRWPLADIAIALGAPLKLLRELADKHVLKGGDRKVEAYVYTPRHGGKDGIPVVLLEANNGPCWYSSRFVRDEYVRERRGVSTRFDGSNGSPKAGPKYTPNPEPKGGLGEPTGYGASTASSFNTNGVDLTIPPVVDKSRSTPKPNGIDIPERQTQARWWTTEQGIVSRGQELGVQSLPGESMQQYKDRLFQAEHGAKRGHHA